MKLPIKYRALQQAVEGASKEDLLPWSANYDLMRQVERASIREFVDGSLKECLKPGMRLLDFGCGSAPYRDLVERYGGHYCWCGYDPLDVWYDRTSHVSMETFDVILCTQVVQYLKWPKEELRALRLDRLKQRGLLIISYPTNWPVCEHTDLWRFTERGMHQLLCDAGFRVVSVVTRAVAEVDRVNSFILGGGIVAVAQ